MSSPSTTQLADQIFNTIKAQEANFPLPNTSKVFIVGTFDANTGIFNYAIPIYRQAVTDAGLKPIILTGGAVNSENVVTIILQFDVVNRQGVFTAAVSGIAPVQTQTANSLQINVGRFGEADFQLGANGRNFSSQLPIQISRVLAGAGAFSIPAVPVAIIYAPPVDQSKKNNSQWSVTNTTGNTTTMSFADGTNVTQGVPSQFDTVNDIAGAVNLASKALGLAKDPVLKGISVGLGIIAEGLGSASASQSQGTTVTTTHSVAVTVSDQQIITTDGNGGGPGHGDLIVYLKNMKLCWFVNGNGPLQIAVLGHDGFAIASADFLKTGLTSGVDGLDPATIKALLALDPFVQLGNVSVLGPGIVLPAGRFVLLDTIDLNGGEAKKIETKIISTQDSTQTTKTSVQVENDKAGWLSFLGLGLPQDLTTTATMTQSSTSQTTSTQTISNTIDLFAQPEEKYTVEIYCDVVFGTFAYRSVTSLVVPVLTGLAEANALVTLVNNGKKFTTQADATGKYAFYADTIAPGASQVSSGTVLKTIALTTSGSTALTLDVRQ